MIDSPDITDIYFTEKGYSTEGLPGARFQVARPPVRTASC
jgi:hypothetical protein